MSDQEGPLQPPPLSTTDHSDFAEPSQEALIARLGARRDRKYVRFVAAALGSIPWIGGLIAASASFSSETEQQRLNELQRMWLEQHKEKIKQLITTLADIFIRLDNLT